MNTKLIILSLFTILLGSVGADGQVFTENFGSLADATVITTSNTSFTYARLSTTSSTSPLMEAQSPGSFTGSSMLLLSQGGSLTGVGATGFTGFNVGTFDISIKTPTVFTGSTLFIGFGTGTTFTGSTTFSGSQLTAGFQVTGTGVLQTRTGLSSASGSWVDTGITLSTSTSYNIRFLFNGSASTVNYAGGSVVTTSADIFLNGVLTANDIAIKGPGVDTTGFRIYMTGGTSSTAFELDNIGLYSTAVPEPSTYAAILGSLALTGVVMLRRRRQAVVKAL